MIASAAELVTALRDGLAALSDPAKAPHMQAYMKSTLPYRGVATPERVRMARAVLAARPPTERATWEEAVRELWDGAAFREERYLAVDVSAHRSARPWQDAATVPLYEHMVVAGAWWDHVDAVAIHLIGPILRADHAGVEPAVRRWTCDANLWRRRASIIVQNRSKGATDVDLLATAVTANIDDGEFFIRKAIGWALREYAKTDPAWVGGFVDAHADRLSPRSRREATKHLPRSAR